MSPSVATAQSHGDEEQGAKRYEYAKKPTVQANRLRQFLKIFLNRKRYAI